MYKNAKDKGITLTSLVVTIVLLLILSTIAYETGKGTVENARLSAYRAEMTIMQEEVDKLEQEIRQGKLNESAISQYGQNLSGVEGATEALQNAGITDAEEQSEYKYYDADALKALGIENVENGYLINISKRSVISVSGIKYKGEKYYTIADVPGGKYIVEKQEIESSVTFNATSDVQGDRMKIVVSNITYTGDVKKGSIYYRHENDEAGKWIRVTNETTDTSYTIEVLKEGTYQVKVVPTTDKEEKNVVPVEVPVYLANYVIAETGIKYVTLADAINSATSGQTITQTRNCADSSEARISGKSIILNNNNRNITKKTNPIVVESGATLEIAGKGTIATTDGITAINNHGTLTVGKTTDSLSTSSPSIQGGNYGIETDGTFNFYNGIIKGTTAAFDNAPSSVRDDYEVVIGTETISGVTYKTATLGINTITVNAPTNLAVSTAGIVTWTNSSNATGYQISLDGTNWTDATSGINYLSTITATPGEKTIYVKAINSDTENYESTNASIATVTTTVYTVTFTSNDTTKGTVSPANVNVIAGATYQTNGNTLTVKGITTGTTETTIATVTATAANGCGLFGWSSTSGNIITNTTITATFIEANYSITASGNTTYYETLAAAMASAQNNQTIKQIRNYTDSSEVVITEGKNIKFDNNEKTLTKTTDGITINNGATLEIAGNGTITTSQDICLIYNSGTVNITHTGTISSTATGESRPIENHGRLTKTGSGKIESSTEYSTIGNFEEGAILTISGGTISSTGSTAIHSYDDAILNIEGTAKTTSNSSASITLGGFSTKTTLNITSGTIENGIFVFDEANGSKITIAGGQVKGGANGIYVDGESNAIQLIMTGGQVEASLNGLYIGGSQVTITGGQVKGGVNGVYANTGTLTIGNGETELNRNNPEIIGGDCGIKKAGDGVTWNFYNGVIKGAESAYSNEPNAHRSGCVIAKEEEIISGTTYQIAYLKNIFTVTLDNSNATNSGTTAIYEKYNDGYYLESSCTNKMTTSSNAITIPTKTNCIFNGYYTETTGGTQYIDSTGKITSSAVATNFTNDGSLYAQWTEANYSITASGNTTYYETLAAAMATVQNNQTITVINGVTETATPTLSSGKTGVKLDMNGKTTTLDNQTLTNSGELDIYSSVNGGKLTSSIANATITNNGTLTTNGTSSTKTLSITNTSNSYNARVITNNANSTATLKTNTTLTFETALAATNIRYLITDNGILNIQGATLTNTVSANQYDKGINIANAAGRVIMTSGTINTYNDAIYNGSGTGTDTPAISISGTTSETTITSTNGSAINNTKGTAVIDGGTMTSSTSRTVISSGTTTTTNITGGSITSDSSNPVRISSGTINVSGGTITTTNQNAIYGGGGILNISGGTISSTSSGNGSSYSTISNQSASTFNITGGEITATNTNAITSFGPLNVSGGTITSTNNNAIGLSSSSIGSISGNTTTITGKTGVSINSSATATITGGTITATNGNGIDSSGTLTIGTDDGTVTSTPTSKPSITGSGSNYGVRASAGTFNFYDGVIRGGTNKSISREPDGKPTGYGVQKTTTGSVETAILSNIHTIALNNAGATSAGTTAIYEKYNDGYYLESSCTNKMTTSSNAITIPTKTNCIFNGYYTETTGGTQYIDSTGKITSSAVATNFTNDGSLYAQWTEANYSITASGNTTYYETLAAAMASAQNNQTIKVLNSVTETDAPTLSSSKTGVKLDMNGKTTTLDNQTLTNNGELDIYSSVNGGKLTSCIAGAIITNNGTLTTNGTSNTKTLSITNTSDSIIARVITNNASKTATLNTNTTLTLETAISETVARYIVYDSGILNIQGASIINTVTGNRYDLGIYIGNAAGRVVMTSGSINTGGDSIYNGSGTGTTTPAVSISGTTSETNITSSNAVAIRNTTATGKITISGGTIASSSYGVINDSTGTIDISGGTISGGTSDGAYNYSTGTINVSAGSISGRRGIANNVAGIINITGGTISATAGIGVYASSGTVTVGTDDGTVTSSATAKPEIIGSGTNYGVEVSSSGTFNFYDGVIKSGVGKSISKDPDRKPTGYYVKKTTADSVETATLSNTPLTISLNNQGATSAGTTAIYEKYNDGYYLESSCTNKMTTSSNAITIPTKTNCIFNGYYTETTGGTQYIDSTGKITSSAVATNFTNDGTLYAQWTEANYSITVSGTTTYYGTLAAAMASASDGSTIKLLHNYTDTVDATVNKNITLDLQTYTLTRDKTITVGNGKTATLTGSTGSKLTTGTTNVHTITNQGTLTIDGSATIEHNATGTSYYAINNSTAGGIVNVKSGTITSVTYGIYNNNSTAVTNIGDSTATLSTTNPTISGGTYGVYNNSGKWTYSNGNIKGTTSSFYDGDVTTNGGLEGGVRTDYIIVTGESGSYKTAHLEKMTDVTTPWLPSGASYTNTNLNTGVTMKDSYNNEWTWVVVPKTVTSSASLIGANEDPTGSSLETVLKNYAATVVTNNSDFTDTWIGEAYLGLTSEEYSSKKRNMLNGIKTDGGFWIGKYEMGYLETPTSSNYRSTSRTAVVQKDAYPYNNTNLPDTSFKTELLAWQTGYDGSLIFGTQWDLTLGYLVNRGGVSKNSATVDSTNWGNYKDKELTVVASTTKSGWPMGWTGTTYNWATFTGTKSSNTGKLLSTGAVEDVTNKLNIVDLAGNCIEWTMAFNYGQAGRGRRLQ